MDVALWRRGGRTVAAREVTRVRGVVARAVRADEGREARLGGVVLQGLEQAGERVRVDVGAVVLVGHDDDGEVGVVSQEAGGGVCSTGRRRLVG